MTWLDEHVAPCAVHVRLSSMVLNPNEYTHAICPLAYNIKCILSIYCLPACDMMDCHAFTLCRQPIVLFQLTIRVLQRALPPSLLSLTSQGCLVYVHCWSSTYRSACCWVQYTNSPILPTCLITSDKVIENIT